MHRRRMFSGVALALLAVSTPAFAQAAQPDATKVALDTVWVLVTAFLVFWMNAGFATLEAGLCRAKNAVNILAKNFIVFAASSIAFWVIGFGLMFGDGSDYGYGLTGWMLQGADNSPATGDGYMGVFGSLNWTGVPLYAKFFFQLVFAGTAATIVSGAVAERIKFLSFIVFSFILVGVIYPLGGHWAWGGGWLADMGFLDFAGSTVVHSIGGWCALTGVIFLGPRMGKYLKDGTVRPIPGHNMGLATLGTLILWLGWFGFNPGSTMAADPAAIASIALNTNMAAAAGCLSACAVAWVALGKPDLSMILNGTLAGLVAITAPCSVVSVGSSVLIGLIAGVIVVYAVLFFDKVKLDDPVGALSVHLVNGVFGTLAVGLFATEGGLFFGGGAAKLLTQLTGVVAVGAATFVLSAAAWLLLKSTMGIRVSAEEEAEGLDIGEHGMDAYPGFVPTQEARAEII
ncbi:MAG: ammonium transporter [Acidobacteria bacterium]|nr:ammonium transporter [Acidobacteriota bacterium]